MIMTMIVLVVVWAIDYSALHMQAAIESSVHAGIHNKLMNGLHTLHAEENKNVCCISENIRIMNCVVPNF